MRGLRALNLSLAFLLELGALVALGYWGFRTGNTVLAKWLLGLGAPLLAAVVWGLFVAPKAVRPVPGPARLALKALVFGSAAFALARAGQPTLGWVFFAVAAINTILLQVFGEGS